MLKRLTAILTVAVLLLGTSYAEEEAVRIAFLDSGVSVKHIDSSKVAGGENFVFPTWDTSDRIGHGTATAGLVTGSYDLALKAVCPSAVIVPLVLYDIYPTGVEKTADDNAFAEAIRAAVDKYSCDIINISMGLTTDSPEVKEAVSYALDKGVIIVSAVGNRNETAPDMCYYPAMYDGVIGVGASDGDSVAVFSQRNGVDILGPGVRVKTVTARNAPECETRSGTSFACAFISGCLAYLLAEDKSLTASEAAEKLFSYAEDIGPIGFDSDSGYGIIDCETGKKISCASARSAIFSSIARLSKH